MVLALWRTAPSWANVLGTVLIGTWGIHLVGVADPSSTQLWVARGLAAAGLLLYGLSFLAKRSHSRTIKEIEKELVDEQRARSEAETRLTRLLRASEEGLRARLASLAGTLGLAVDGRISLYAYSDGTFVRWARHSDHPDYNHGGRGVLAGDEGLIADAFRASASSRWTVSFDRSRTGDRRTAWEGEMGRMGDRGLPFAVVSRLRMMSMSYIFWPLTLPNDSTRVGIVVFEHLQTEGLRMDDVRRHMRHRARELALALVAVLEASTTDDGDGTVSPGQADETAPQPAPWPSAGTVPESDSKMGAL